MSRSPSETSGPPRQRVLLVDYDFVVRRAVARILCREFDVVTAVDAADAIAKIDVNLYAIVTDHDLGAGPDGRAVLAAACSRAPNARRILTSGRLQSLPSGDADLWHAFLVKPVSRDELFSALGPA